MCVSVYVWLTYRTPVYPPAHRSSISTRISRCRIRAAIRLRIRASRSCRLVGEPHRAPLLLVSLIGRPRPRGGHRRGRGVDGLLHLIEL